MHVVFSTKERRPMIPPESQIRLWAYMGGMCKKEGIFVREIGGMPDHVHLFIQQPPTMALSDIVLKIKAASSKWMGPRFAWQRGFGGFSVSASNANAVVRYIRDQERHHRKMSYEEEIFAMYRKHGMRFDPKYALG
jgi:REP element-mobilizing transposase RayT